MAKKALLIVNPNSRDGAVEDLNAGVQRLRENGMEVNFVTSCSAEESRAVIDEHGKSIQLVILGGGDGTISAVLEVVLKHNLALGVLPLGTANDFARTLRIPESLQDAFDLLILNQRRKIDVGEVNGHLFLNAAHMGLGVMVTKELDSERKRRWGVFSYLNALRRAFLKRDRFTISVEIDGQHMELRSVQVAVGNGRYYGGGNVLDERASIRGGWLHFYSIRPLRTLEFLSLAPQLRSGRSRDHKRIYRSWGHEIVVHCKSRALEIHADGEAVSHTPARFRVKAGLLEVIAPPE